MDSKVLNAVTSHLKFLGRIRLISIDNWIFSCHYRFTTWLLLVFSGLLGFTQFFGDPVKCVKTEKFIEQKVVDRYCLVEGTITLSKALNKAIGVDSIPHPGVDVYEEGDDIIYHKYYQWVAWVLFLQALSFYTPRAIWKVKYTVK